MCLFTHEEQDAILEDPRGQRELAEEYRVTVATIRVAQNEAWERRRK
jgi:hypothetical protein